MLNFVKHIFINLLVSLEDPFADVHNPRHFTSGCIPSVLDLIGCEPFIPLEALVVQFIGESTESTIVWIEF